VTNAIYAHYLPLSGIHMKYHEPNADVFKCAHCKYIVSTQQLLDDHYKRNHDPTRPKDYVCHICGKSFYTSRHVKSHLRGEYIEGVHVLGVSVEIELKLEYLRWTCNLNIQGEKKLNIFKSCP